MHDSTPKTPPRALLVVVVLLACCDGRPSRAATVSVRPENTTTATTVEGLLAALTLDEKYALLTGINGGHTNLSDGYYVGNTPPVPRLGIPALKMQDAGNGFRTTDPRIVGTVTSWPCALALAATWNRAAVGGFARAAAAEFALKGANVVLGPGLNLHRVARGGRNAEYLTGEDPVLGAELAKPWVDGFREGGIVTTAKHFVLNNQETNRYSYSARASERALREMYYAPFRAAVRAGVGAYMCSYNQINGTPACSNEKTLREDLEGKDLGFDKGFVVSDWGAAHGTTLDQGLDVDMPGTDGFYSPAALIANASIAAVDAAVRRVLAPLVDLDLVGRPSCAPGSAACAKRLYEVNATTADRVALALDLATESVVLLKNDRDVLPLSGVQQHHGRSSSSFEDDSSRTAPRQEEERDTKKTTIRRVGVVGAACDAPNDVDAMLADDGVGNYYVIGGSGRVIPAAVTTVYGGLVDALSEANESFEVVASLVDSTEAALALEADVLVACGGATTAEAADRATLRLDQDAFLTDLARSVSQQRLVVVALAPGALVLSSFIDDVDAAVVAFLGGAQTGRAVAAVLVGMATPSAKLPVTFPASEAQTVAPCLDAECPYDEDLFVGYRGLADEAVAFPFGHGLSYTTFGFEWVPQEEQTPRRKTAAACWDAVVRVANTGARRGAEVVQVYVTFPDAAAEPRRILREFHKTPVLEPGETARVPVSLCRDTDLAVYNVTSASFVFVPGTYQIFVGASSRDIRLNVSVGL